jgi:hypothetical protein
MIIKILLIAAALGFGVLVMRDSVPGHNLLRRLGGIAAVVLGIVAVLWPMLTTYVANAIGVGRGTDLVLYVLVVVFVFNALATTQRIHGLERALTALVRELAISRATQAEPPPLPTDRADGPPTS